MFIVFLGTMLICFTKKQKLGYIGNVILGFGLIFYGMSGMGDSLAALKELPQFEAIALSMSNYPILAMLAGVLLTAAVQSSAATIGIIQKLYQAGAVTFSASLPFMFGANIGTTMTGFLASIGGSKAGKRTALMHTTINVISTIIGMLLLIPYAAFIQRFFGNLNPMMQIAVSNIIFKVITTLLFLPFVKQLVTLVKKIIPGDEDETLEIDVDEMDEEITTLLPSAAVKTSEQAILKLIDVVRFNVTETQRFLLEGGGSETKAKLDQTEAIINRFDHKITNYLIRLSVKRNLTMKDKDEIRSQLDAVKNYERIGDLNMNLAEFFQMVENKDEKFSESAMKEINEMFMHLVEMIDLSTEIFVTHDETLYHRLQELEKQMDKMENNARYTHFERMRDGICTSPIAESVYIDVIGTLERMGDHSCNVAKSAVTHLTSDLSDDEVIATKS